MLTHPRGLNVSISWIADSEGFRTTGSESRLIFFAQLRHSPIGHLNGSGLTRAHALAVLVDTCKVRFLLLREFILELGPICQHLPM